MRRSASAPRGRGFTLVEVLVALFAMALLAGLAWQTLDAVMRSRDAGRVEIDRTARLATVLAQWEQDLQSLQDTGATPRALGFDGRSLRLTRRLDGGVALVVWSVQGGRWQRWASPPVQRAGALAETWLRSLQLVGNEAAQVTVADGAGDWQLYFFRGGAWSNAQSSGDLEPPTTVAGTRQTAPPREQLPDAVRLVITLDGQRLTRDIALGPSAQ